MSEFIQIGWKDIAERYKKYSEELEAKLKEACERDMRNIDISANLKEENDRLKTWIIQNETKI